MQIHKTLSILLAGAILCGFSEPPAFSEGMRRPVLVELFTSEGCSSCPPADQVLAVLDSTQPVEGVQVVVLSEHVDYWDSLGWRDPNSSPQFSQRQEMYVRRLKVENAYTPELVVDGRQELVGSRASDARTAIERAARNVKLPIEVASIDPLGGKARVSVSVEAGSVEARSRTGSGARVFLVVATNEVKSKVGSGENAGRQLSHVAVVRTLDELGPLGGNGGFHKDVTLKARPDELPNLRVIVFIQNSKSLEVLGANTLTR